MPREKQAAVNDNDLLIHILDLLLAARNAINSGASGDIAKISGTTIDADLLFRNRTTRTLFFNFFGLLSFLNAYLYARATGLTFRESLSKCTQGRGLRLAVAFLLGSIGGIILFTQCNTKSSDQITAIMSLGLAFSSFGGYASGDGDAGKILEAMRKKINKSSEAASATSQITPSDVPNFKEIRGEKGTLEELLHLFVSCRNAALEGGGPDLVMTVSSGQDNVDISKILFSYASIELVFGGVIAGAMIIALLSDIFSGRLSRDGFAKIAQDHFFSGKKIQLLIAAVFSLTGSLLMLSNRQDHPSIIDLYIFQFSSYLLFTSGFFTGPKSALSLVPSALQSGQKTSVPAVREPIYDQVSVTVSTPEPASDDNSEIPEIAGTHAVRLMAGKTRRARQPAPPNVGGGFLQPNFQGN